MRKPHIEWRPNGHAYQRVTHEAPCPGPTWAKECQGRWEDEYGSAQWCPTCTYGNGTRIVVEYVRRPEYDAPAPGSLDPKPLTELIGEALSNYGELNG